MSSSRSLHFIGALTPEMVSLINYSVKRGDKVTASDDHTDKLYAPVLASLGVTFFDMFAQTNVSRTTDCVILSRFYDVRHSEVMAAQNLAIPVLSENDFTKEIVASHRLLAVLDDYDGALTATWLHHVWQLCHVPSSLLAHTINAESGSDVSAIGDGEWFIVPFSGFKRDAVTYEADFLSFQPETVVVPSLRYDYPELNTTLDEVYQSYYTLAKRIPRKGLIVGNNDYSRMKRLRSHLVDRHTEVYGLERDSDWHIREVEMEGEITRFTLANGRQLYGPFTIPLRGERFVYAAAAVCVLSLLHELSLASVAQALATVPQLKRYFETYQDSEGRTLILDKADHPELIASILTTVRTLYPEKKIWCLYQPGSYLRTKALMQELQTSLQSVDYLYLADIKGYPKEKSEGLHMRHFVAEMRRQHNQTYYFENAQEMRALLDSRVPSNDLIIALGAEGMCQEIVLSLCPAYINDAVV